VNALDRLPALLEALNAESVDYVLFGGQAVNLHGILRFTDDIDVFVSPTADNVARLHRALRRVWDDPAIEKMCADDVDIKVIRRPIAHHRVLTGEIRGSATRSRLPTSNLNGLSGETCAGVLRRRVCCIE